jgi:hypothetical protein
MDPINKIATSVKPLVNFRQMPTVMVNLSRQTVSIIVHNDSGATSLLSIEAAVKKGFISVEPSSFLRTSHAIAIRSSRVVVVVQEAEIAAEEEPSMTDAEYRQMMKRREREQNENNQYGLQKPDYIKHN